MLRLAFILVILIHSISFHSQDTDLAKEIVHMLASKEFKGRGFTGNGHLIAANYIGNLFRKTGLLAFGNPDANTVESFFQPFEIRVNTFPSKMKVDIDGHNLAPGTEFLIHPSSPSVKGTFRLIRINKEKLADSAVWNEFPERISGCFVIIDERDFYSNDRKLVSAINERIEYLKFSKDLHSAGTVILTNEKLTWGISTSRSIRPVLFVKSNNIGPAPSNINVNIRSELSIQTTNNVIGYVPGKEVPDSFLVITAHYDHLGKMGRDVIFPGANDNASGIAMLLSLAGHFKLFPPRYSIVFMALSAEETGLNGARHFVKNPLFDIRRIIFLVNFDLAGTGDEGIKVVNGSVYTGKFNLLKSINSSENYLKDIQIRGPACNSDHCVFYEAGVPCFYIYTLGGIQAYHDVYDRAETLPLTEFADYRSLIIEFFEKLKF